MLAALPSTLIGGVIAVALTGGTLSLGAMVGFVALFGMAARNTILSIPHYEHLVASEAQPWSLATALRGAEERLTPVPLTALLTALALLPVALQSREPGHEIEVRWRWSSSAGSFLDVREPDPRAAARRALLRPNT